MHDLLAVVFGLLVGLLLVALALFLVGAAEAFLTSVHDRITHTGKHYPKDQT